MIPFPLLLPGSVFQQKAAASVSVSALRERRCSSPSPSSISGRPRSPRSRSLPSAASRRLSFPHETERRAPAASVFATRCSGSGVPEWACHHEQGSPDHSLFSRGLLAFCSWRFPPRLFLPPLAHAVDGIIRRDSIDPRSEVRSRCELSQLLVRPQKGLLNHLFGVVPIPGHAVGQAKNILAVPFDENAKRIAIAGERALDGEGVAVCDGIGALDALRHPIH